VVGVDYPLAPEAPFPTAIEHCAALVEWLRAEAASLGLDAARLAIAGDSAGANLAIATAMTLRNEDRPPPTALILAYGVYDCDFSRASYRRFGAGDYPLSAERMKFLWSTYLADPALRSSSLASPLQGDLSGLPPTRLIIAEADVLYDENVELAARLREAGNATQAVVYLGTCHGFIEAPAVAGISRRAIAEAGNWLATVTVAE
jgi:acetyl esterase